MKINKMPIMMAFIVGMSVFLTPSVFSWSGGEDSGAGRAGSYGGYRDHGRSPGRSAYRSSSCGRHGRGCGYAYRFPSSGGHGGRGGDGLFGGIGGHGGAGGHAKHGIGGGGGGGGAGIAGLIGGNGGKGGDAY